MKGEGDGDGVQQSGRGASPWRGEREGDVPVAPTSTTATAYYPAYLDLRRRRCLVVGGGEVAERKVETLRECGATITVVSPTLTPGLAEAAQREAIVYHARVFENDDLEGAHLVIAATDDRAANAAVAKQARQRRIWVNSVDDPDSCDFIAPSVVKRGDLVLAISTAGKSPAMARWVREELDRSLPEEWGSLLELAHELRQACRQAGRTPPYSRWAAALSPAVREALRRGAVAEARREMAKALGLGDGPSAEGAEIPVP
ncbi:MAG: bifunctional precorrin-2 dehydrogenase/sirohydrochlorin ferrochelatase [Chloroflexi bacterium]|nr:bifunctional precorrin-2 dehydrogenase/sirohydrochlorin ferrochelatase [Chloroflexota bacterium]